MLRTKYERQAAIQRLINQPIKSEISSFIREEPESNTIYEQEKSTVSKDNRYDIPAEVIISQTTKAKQENNLTQISQNMQRYVYK
jgi:hypothetical protein